jgi:hypothetical protein
MRYAGKVILHALLCIAAAVLGAWAGTQASEELAIRYEMVVTGATHRSELADDKGLAFVALFFYFPGLLVGAVLGMVAMWLLLVLWNGAWDWVAHQRADRHHEVSA